MASFENTWNPASDQPIFCQLLDFVQLFGSNYSTDLKKVAQFYENDGQLRQHDMVKLFIEEGIQTKINAIGKPIGMVGNGEALETGLQCLRKAKK